MPEMDAVQERMKWWTLLPGVTLVHCDQCDREIVINCAANSGQAVLCEQCEYPERHTPEQMRKAARYLGLDVVVY